MRDGDPSRFNGGGVLEAVGNVNNTIGPWLKGRSPMDQESIDVGLNELDGTDDKSNLGANAVLAVSLAVAKAAAGVSTPGGSLWKYLADGNPVSLPVPMFNILNGFRVLDLTTVVLGPFSTQMLGDFGAEVIKIENLGGDMMRAVRPGKSDEMGAGFVNCNRNKDCVAINLKREQGKEIFYRLVKSADAVVHNMRNKTAVNLGIGYEDLKVINPDIVYCGAQGFGEKGSSSDIPAYDDIIQAASGLSYLNSDEQGRPRYLPTIVADKVSGLQLTAAVLGGLINKLRTGKGCFIESPMFEGLVAFLMTEQLAGHSYIPSTGTTGYDRLTAPYRRPYPSKVGYLAILPFST